MKKGILRQGLLLILAFLLVFSTAVAETEDVDAQAEKIFRAHKTTGGTVLVARDGEIVYRMNYGFMNKKQQIPVDDSTHFRIASVTKMVSAMYMMQLVEQGLVDLDADVSDYLGFTMRNPYYYDTPITLRMLMTHTASITRQSGVRGRTLESLLGTKSASFYLNAIPGRKYAYSNLGAGVMGSIIESVTGKNINDAVTEGVFQPLQMDAAYHPALIQDVDSITNVYDNNCNLKTAAQKLIDEEWDAGVDPAHHYNITVGSLWITGEDLLRLGMLICNGGELDGVRLLQEDTVAEMMAEQQGKGGITASTPYGLCVNRNDTLIENRMVYGHQGISGAIAANVYYEPESRFVFVLITNGCKNGQNNRVCAISRKMFTLMWENFGEE